MSIPEPEYLYCKYCLENFDNERSIQEHYRLKHKDEENENDLIPEGSDAFSLHPETVKNNLDSNLDSKTPNVKSKHFARKPHKCNTCYKEVYDLRKHEKTHRKRNDVYCPHCPKKFGGEEWLNLHCEKVHPDVKPTIECGFCTRKFYNKDSRTAHVKRTHYGKDSEVPEAVKNDLDSNFEKNPFVCSFCSKEFTSRTDFRSHERDHIDNKEPYKCRFCDKTYRVKRRMRNHETSHGEKKIECEFCTSTFYNKDSQKNHVKRHHTEKDPEVLKKLTCDICSNQFSTEKVMILHRLQHSGHKPFKCNKCYKEFYDEKLFQKHEETHRKNNDLYCPHCPKKFGGEEWLKLHCEKVHPDVKPIIVTGNE